MSAEIRYLSQRSVAVYEATLIEQFASMHRRNVQIQFLTVTAYVVAFMFLASMTMVLPAATQNFLRYLFPY